MNKRLSVYLLSLLGMMASAGIMAQEDNVQRITVVRPKYIQRSGWYFGLSFAPEYAYRTLSTPAYYNPEVVPNMPELPKLSATMGLQALYHFNNHLAIETGLLYSMKGEKTENYRYTDPQSGKKYRRTGNYTTQYLEVPLLLQYCFTTVKCAPFIEGGVTANIFLGERMVFHNTYDNGTYDRTVEHNAETVFMVRGVPYKKENDYYFINPQAQISVGIDYCDKHWRIKTAPVFSISLLDVNRGPVYERFYSIGWKTVVYLGS